MSGTRKNSLFVFGVVRSDVMEENHKEEETNAQNVGKDGQLHISNHAYHTQVSTAE